VAAYNVMGSRPAGERLMLVFGVSFVHGMGIGHTFTEVASLGYQLPLFTAVAGCELAALVVFAVSGLLFYLLPRASRDRAARDLNVVLLLTGVVLFLQRTFASFF
jgi:hypothetical protein